MSKGAISRAEVPLPGDGAVAVQRDDLAGAEPRVDPRAVGDGARRGEVVLVVDRRERALGFDPPLPQPLAVGARKRLDDEERLARRRPRRAPASSARSPCVAASPPCTSRGWFPSRRTPAPICDVTKTRSPLTIGVETPDAGERRLPRDVLGRAPAHRQRLVARDAARAGTAPVRPVGRGQRDAGNGEPEQQGGRHVDIESA